jgi:hypothetical protein
MGAAISTSYSNYNSITSVISEAILNDISKCNATTIINQGINVDNVDGDVVMTNINLSSDQSLSLKCLQESSTNLDIKNDIDEKLKQSIENKLSGLNFGLGVSSNINILNSITNVSNSLDISIIKECMYVAITNQTINFGTVKGDFIIDNLNMKAVQKTVSECIQKNNNIVNSINSLTKDVDQISSNSIEGILAGPLGSVVIILGVIVVLIIAYYLFFGGKREIAAQAIPVAEQTT